MMKKSYIRVFYALSCTVSLLSCRNVDLMDNPEEPISEHSSTVSVDDAKMVAANFFNKQNISLQASIDSGIPTFNSYEIDEVQTLGDDDNVPILYVVNLKNNKGYVVMSASDLEKPILAYGNSGKFSLDDIEKSIGIMNWIETKYSKIQDLIKEDKEPDEWITQQWYLGGRTTRKPAKVDIEKNVEASTYARNQYGNRSKGPLLKTSWSQRLDYRNNNGELVVGYNNFIGKDCGNGKKALAGCVAVAMGQIMKYHNWPNFYDIQSMPNEIGIHNYKYPGSQNIAHLLGYIGQRVNMKYGCNISTTSSEYARNAFVSTFKYSASNLVNADIDIIKRNIDANKPVYMDGCKNSKTREIKVERVRYEKSLWWRIKRIRYTETHYQQYYDDCHAWVADGYIDEGGKSTKLHMNWGWGSSWNGKDGWYDYENVNASDPSVRYRYIQRMIYNITPNK